MSDIGVNTVPRLFYRRVAEHGDRVALRKKALGRWQAISWRDYGQRVREVASGLMALGLRRGESVCIIAENRPEWLYCDLGVMAAGGISVGVYATSSPEQCEHIVSHSEARVFVVEDDGQLDKALQVRSRVPVLARIIVLDMKRRRRGKDPMVMDFGELLAVGRQYDAEDTDRFRRRLDEGKPEDIATLVYTSGTTGPPKGVMLSHETVLFTTTMLEAMGPIYASDETVSYLPLSHIAERLLTAFGQIRYGYTVNFAERPDTFPQDLRDVSPQILFGPPRVWEKFHSAIALRMDRATPFKRRAYRAALGLGARAARRRLRGQTVPVWLRLACGLAYLAVFRKLRGHLGLDRARYVFSGAAPISPDILAYFWSIGVPLREVYGQTESCGPATAHLGDRVRLGTVGQAIPGCDVRIAEDGEILVRGRNVFQGYFRDPQATAMTLREGWLYTGDVGRLDENGFLALTDRKKDLIITAGGKNVAPQVIESRLKSSPYIADAVVIGDRRTYLVALIVLDEEHVVSYAQACRIPFTTLSDLSKKAEVCRLISQELERVNSTLSQPETVKRFAILEKTLDPEDGDVTPTLKVKRRAVSERYGELIESLYVE